MLFKRPILEGIAAGRVTLAFRRWRRPTVRGGGTLRTALGVVAIESVTPAAASDISERQAKDAGHASLEELMETLGTDGDLPVFRIALRFAGDDPLTALRADDTLSAEDAERLNARLARLDKASPRGPWTGASLRLVERRPAVRAAELAGALGCDTASFKRDMRKLKELGLTESLDTGYRLSPRGLAWLALRRSP